jgi:hypothetical protein
MGIDLSGDFILVCGRKDAIFLYRPSTFERFTITLFQAT